MAKEWLEEQSSIGDHSRYIVFTSELIQELEKCPSSSSPMASSTAIESSPSDSSSLALEKLHLSTSSSDNEKYSLEQVRKLFIGGLNYTTTDEQLT